MSPESPAPQPPTTFPVSVIVSREPVQVSQWVSERWEVRGVVAGEGIAQAHAQKTTLRVGEAGEQTLWTGFELELFKDEAESYYLNLMGEKPSVFVICRVEEADDDEEELVPFLATLSYDEAASYMDADDAVYSVPIPPEVYLWVERYVVENYVPGENKKRKRTKWWPDERHGAR